MIYITHVKFVALGLFFVLVVVFFPLIPVVNGNVVKATVSVLQDDKKNFLNRQGFLLLLSFFPFDLCFTEHQSTSMLKKVQVIEAHQKEPLLVR